MKRTLILILALLMCTTALFGCKKSQDDDTDTVSTVDVDNSDELGAYYFDGADFTILARQETSYEHIGELNGDSVSEAVYGRNLAVSERFGVNIKVVEISGAWESTAFKAAVVAEHGAGSGAYDLLSTHSVVLGRLTAEGLLTDLNKLPVIDLTKDYWNQNLKKELTIGESCYMMIGDSGHTLYEYISVMFVNTQLIKEHQVVNGGIDGIYDMVDNGTWTWEALYNMTKDYGNGSEDQSYGLIFNTHAMRASMLAQEAGIYSRADNGNFEMKSAASEHMVDAVLKLSKFFALPNNYFEDGWYFDQEKLNPMFTSGKSMFYGQILGESAKFAADMGEGYAVLPLPKFDEEQFDYYTICADEVTGFAVMEASKSHEMSGVITQALAKYGSEYVTPEYYEKALKYRYATDPRCPEILDKIRESLTIEAVPTFYDTQIDSDMFRDIVRLGKSDGIASQYESYVSKANEQLSAFYSMLEALQE